MPDVNMVDMCYPLYWLKATFVHTAEGLPLERAIYKHAPVSIFEALLEKGKRFSLYFLFVEKWCRRQNACRYKI